MGIYFNPRFHFAFCICHGFYLAIPFLFALHIGDVGIVQCYFKNHYIAIQIGDYFYYEKTNTGYEWLKNIKEVPDCKLVTIGPNTVIVLQVEVSGRKETVVFCKALPALTTNIGDVDPKVIDTKRHLNDAEFYEKIKPFVCRVGVFVAFYCFQNMNNYKKVANKIIINNRINCLTKFQNVHDIYTNSCNDEMFV